jgi:hypothetical protein
MPRKSSKGLICNTKSLLNSNKSIEKHFEATPVHFTIKNGLTSSTISNKMSGPPQGHLCGKTLLHTRGFGLKILHP